MSRAPAARFADATEVASGLAAWLDGVQRTEQALACAHRALARGPRARQLRTESAARLEAVRARLAAVPSWEDEAAKLDLGMF